MAGFAFYKKGYCTRLGYMPVCVGFSVRDFTVFSIVVESVRTLLGLTLARSVAEVVSLYVIITN